MELEIKLKKSLIGKTKKQRANITGLGLKKINQVVKRSATPEIMGVIKKVGFLLEVTEIGEE